MAAIASFSVARESGQCQQTHRLWKPIYTRFQGDYKKKTLSPKKKNLAPGGGHFDYRWKAENLIRWSPYSWVTSLEKFERSNNYFSSYRVNKIFFKSLTLTFDLWPWVKKVEGGVECLYELWNNLLHPVGVVAKRVCAAAAAHEGDDNTPSGPTGRGVETRGFDEGIRQKIKYGSKCQVGHDLASPVTNVFPCQIISIHVYGITSRILWITYSVINMIIRINLLYVS